MHAAPRNSLNDYSNSDSLKAPCNQQMPVALQNCMASHLIRSQALNMSLRYFQDVTHHTNTANKPNNCFAL